MKLLLDQNLSPHLVGRLADLFPASRHVSQIGLDRALDHALWTYALTNDFLIVTKDADFGDLAAVLGFPPKVIWLRLGNCTTAQIEHTLRTNHATIVELAANPTIGVLILI